MMCAIHMSNRTNSSFRLRLFWVKMISGNHFHPFPHVWLQRKIQFSGNAFLLTKIFPFDPEMNLRSHFHFNSFPGHSHAQQHREKREAKHKTNAHTATQRVPIHAQQHREKETVQAPIHISGERSTPIHISYLRSTNQRGPIHAQQHRAK